MKTYSILFVCLGNICRSPMAEYVFRHRAHEAGVAHRVSVQSAGTSGWHDGEDMHRNTAAMLQSHGINNRGFISSRVKRSDAEQYDFIIAMDDSNLKDLKKIIPYNAAQTFKLTDLIPESGYSHVPDPWYTGDFDETFRLVDAASNALLKKLKLTG